MKKIKLLLVILLMGVSMYSQDNIYSDAKFSLDPSVLINEGNFNIKLEVSTHFNGADYWRVNIVLETLTGHDGYYGGDIGMGFSIPYNIGFWRFKIEPGIAVGMIVRPNMFTLVTSDRNNNIIYSNPGLVGYSHSLNLRHNLEIGDSRWSLYIHNRLIRRTDLHFEQAISITPNELPFYNIDNAVGLAYKF